MQSGETRNGVLQACLHNAGIGVLKATRSETMQAVQSSYEAHKIYTKEGRKHSMEKNIFKIESEEYVIKNLRLKKELVEQGAKIAQTKNISFNKFANIALEFAINHYEED